MANVYETGVDEYSNLYYFSKVLGQGGQGIVYRTRDPDIAIKLVTDSNGNPLNDEKEIARHRDIFRKVRFLPIPKDANIALPAALLKDHAGYAMRLLSEMSPLNTLLVADNAAAKINTDEIPDWLKGMSREIDAKKIVLYYKTGGLRRRLLALYKTSVQLALLHGSGLVYGDISPNNIFISSNIDESAVWFIDADNLKFDGDAGGIYTPRYGAPELVQNKSAGSTATDCHAFAVLAFYMLSMAHPFIGNKVLGNGDGDWADTAPGEDDPEEKAYAGFFPWIYDEGDDSNAAEGGLPPSLLLTEKLSRLFQKTFSDGRVNPAKRPKIFHWPEAFAQAVDTTIRCPVCAMSYYYDYTEQDGSERCPYCGAAKPPRLILSAHHWDGKTLGISQWIFTREIEEERPLRLPARLFTGFSTTRGDTVPLEIKIDQSSILFIKSDDSIEFSIGSKASFKKLVAQARMEKTLDQNFFIHAQTAGSARMIVCQIKGSAK
jgi:serine/threonine protein kinase